ETLTLVQTGKIERRLPIVLFGRPFWDQVINFDTLVEWGVISPHDLTLFKIVDDVDEAADFIIHDLEKDE
ncbi:MAG: LOG family protein, partial [Opitutales bacterium]